MIETKHLAYSYEPNKVMRFPDFIIGKGAQYLLLGESGSGKTTLLHLLGGLLRAQRGNIIINKTDITTLSETALDAFRGQQAGFIFQKNHLINALTVKKNLLMAPFLAGLKLDVKRIEEVLDQLGIADKIDAKVHDLSQGQVQRVSIARAVLNKPAIIFADEPTSALDDKHCDQVIKLLLDVTKRYQTTLVIATHDQRLKSKISDVLNVSSN